jgi:hypothetical protein
MPGAVHVRKMGRYISSRPDILKKRDILYSELKHGTAFPSEIVFESVFSEKRE